MPADMTSSRLPLFALALETSTRQNTVTLIDLQTADPAAMNLEEAEPLETRELPQARRHNIELAPTIQALCQDHQLEPHQLAHWYLSLGPGSFTGLRIAITTAKTFAFATTPHKTKLFGIPTLDVLLQATRREKLPENINRICIALNDKRNTTYACLFTQTDSPRRACDAQRQRLWYPATSFTETLPRDLYPIDQLRAEFKNQHADTTLLVGRPILNDPPPQHYLTPQPTSLDVWHAAKSLSNQNKLHPTPALELTPLYIRPPEAVELWETNKPKTV